MPAQLVGQDAQNDLAVLKVTPSTQLQPVTIGNSSTMQVGDLVVAIVNPLGLRVTVMPGIVSALGRSATEAPSGPAGTLTGLIQTSTPTNPDNSGGVLLIVQGQVVGILTLSAVDLETNIPADGIGYAIPKVQVTAYMNRLIQAAD